MPLPDRIWRWLRLEAADWLLWLKLPQRTRVLYEVVLRDHPDDAHTMSCLAYLDAAQGNRITALERFDRVVQLAPDDVRGHYNRAYLQQELQRHEDAVLSFERALAIRDDHDLAQYGKALSLIALNRFDEAIPALKRATELQPMSPFGWYQLARIYHSRGKMQSAEKIIRHLKGFEPKFADQLIRETGIRVESS